MSRKLRHRFVDGTEKKKKKEKKEKKRKKVKIGGREKNINATAHAYVCTDAAAFRSSRFRALGPPRGGKTSCGERERDGHVSPTRKRAGGVMMVGRSIINSKTTRRKKKQLRACNKSVTRCAPRREDVPLEIAIGPERRAPCESRHPVDN